MGTAKMRFFMVVAVMVAAAGALPLTGDGAAASLLDETHKEHNTLAADTAVFPHDHEQELSDSDTLRGVFREDESAQEAHKLNALERSNENLGESFSGSAKEEERHAKAAERKAEQAADKAMHSINKMEKDVDTRARLKQDMAKIQKEAKTARETAEKKVHAITHHELGESPSKALLEAKKEEAKALHKISHMENHLDAQAKVTRMKAKEMKAVAKEVQSIANDAADASKQSVSKAAKLDKQEGNESLSRAAKLGESPASEKASADAAMKKAKEEAKKATSHIKRLEKDLKKQATLKKDMSKFAAQASSALKSAHHVVSSVKGDDVLGEGEGQQENFDANAAIKHHDDKAAMAKAFEKKTMLRFEDLESAFVRKAKAVEQNHQSLAVFKRAAATATHLKAGKSGTFDSQLADLGDNFDAENTEDTLSKMASTETRTLIKHTNDALAKFSEATSEQIKAIVG